MKSSDWNLSEIFGILLDEFVSDLWIWMIDVYAQSHFINHNTGVSVYDPALSMAAEV